MKIKAEELLSDLTERTRQNIKQAEGFVQRTEMELNQKEALDVWSVLECIEHLNLYGRFYILEIKQQIIQSKSSSETWFKSGFLGNYFAKSMLSSDKMKKIKTFKNKNPNGSILDKKTIENFLEQQNQIVELLNKAREVSLTKTKTAISISKLIQLKLGDTFRVLIYHNERHIVQANRALDLVL